VSSSRVTLGVDEAGRGPALGPMVMAVVALDTRAARALTRAGLRDSKAYGAGAEARATRAGFAARIRACAVHVRLAVIEVDEIDRRVRHGELNVLEREVASRLIDDAPPRHRIVADGQRIFAALAARYPELEARDEGESHHAAVAAASVIAKVRRDELFAEIAARYVPEFGAIAGGGYANAATRRFLRAYAERYRELPGEARRSWPYPYLRDLLGERCMPVKAPRSRMPVTSPTDTARSPGRSRRTDRSRRDRAP
jgi:ribonuclease HII